MYIQTDDNILQRLRTALCDKEYILNPTIDHLLGKEVFKLTHLNETYCIPLWHDELNYKLKTHNLIIKIKPDLEKHIELDISNNIHVHLKQKINVNMDTRVDTGVEFYLGKRLFVIEKNNLLNNNTYPTEIYTIYNEGIPIICEDNIYNCSFLSNIIVHLS